MCVCVCLQTGQSGENLLSLSDAVSQAARTAGVKPVTSQEQLQEDLDSQELKEAYSEQVPGPGWWRCSSRDRSLSSGVVSAHLSVPLRSKKI